jgi:IS30 family transposase
LGGRSGLRRQLTRRLRTGRPLRKRRRRTTQRRTRFVAPGQLIDQRPTIVQGRERVGDWEGDLIVGRSNRSAIATLVDRRSRYVHLVALPHGHDASAVRDALIAALGQLPPAARQTVTWDQGSELAHHEHVSEHLQQGVFFAYPASPWLRGTNENTNGLLRQYFPKGSDLSVHPAEELQRVQDRLNNRPRKTLGWRTPAEVFNDAMRAC